MSIWNHLTELELQSLREKQQQVDEAEWEFNRADVALANQEERLRSVQKEHKLYNEAIVSAAVSGDVVPEQPSHTVEEIQAIVDGLSNRQRELPGQINNLKSSIQSEARSLLTKCIERVSIDYVDTADTLAENWKELNMAQLALGERDLGWMHIAIPGLPCMPTAEKRYNRRSLFIGRDEPSGDDGSVMAELERLLI